MGSKETEAANKEEEAGMGGKETEAANNGKRQGWVARRLKLLITERGRDGWQGD